jgi:hypothetical protein
MNETTRTQIAALEGMRLPELQARYAEVVGEATRCPRKSWLIRRIQETLAERAAAETAAQGESPTQAAMDAPSEPATTSAVETTTLPTVPDTGVDVEEARRVIMANVDPMGYDTAEQYVEECYGQVAPEAMPGLLVEAAQIILDNAASERQLIEGASGATEAAPAEATTVATSQSPSAGEPQPSRKLSKLTVPELQVRLLELVGRASGSVDRNYLLWRVHQAEKGRIPVGPRQPRQPRRAEGEGGAPQTSQDFRVLPLRMESSLVEQLDEARERLGLRSRMALFRAALQSYLTAAGEHDVAALFAAEA